MKILLIAGHGAGDNGAVGNGYREADLTREFVSLLYNELKNVCEVFIADTSRNWFEYLKSNSFDFSVYDYVLEVHFNSGGGTGSEIYVTQSEAAITVEEAILAEINSAVGFRNRGVKRNNWNVITQVKRQGVSAALLELCFIDNASDINIYKNQKIEIAQAVTRGIVKGFGLEVKEMAEFPDVSNHYAKVHINDLLNMGVVNGDDNGNFRPDDTITRADTAIMVRNAIRYITGK